MAMLTTSVSPSVEELRFLDKSQAVDLAKTYGTPLFAYDEKTLIQQAKRALAISAPFGLTVRYAMKANPLAAIIRTVHAQGVHIDASSGFEATRAIRAGIPPEHIMITSQQLPDDLADLVNQGVLFNATSLHQLSTYARQFPGSTVSVRINPGLGSGQTLKTDTGGPAAGFGIWHESLPEAHKIIREHNLTVTRVHTHIGSGSDPQVWQRAAAVTLDLVRQFPDATTVNLGGGFKVARMSHESSTDLQAVSGAIAELIKDFHRETGRRLHLEVEPGTYMVANAGSLVARIQDMVTTGPDGFSFLKLDTGLTEIMRPSLYAAQHPIVVVGEGSSSRDYIVIGHTCESGDLLTPKPGHPDTPATRRLLEARIGDLVVIEGTGAYCSAMSASGYNSFPTPAEVMITSSGDTKLVKRPQSLDQLIEPEVV